MVEATWAHSLLHLDCMQNDLSENIWRHFDYVRFNYSFAVCENIVDVVDLSRQFYELTHCTNL